ncbi:MAG: hypothetical protein COA69_04005 [Robiginitomaculum sp.]|nr:MAG: hypothetical protein COA69_04005 [Robiginitomaculum sp.]
MCIGEIVKLVTSFLIPVVLLIGVSAQAGPSDFHAGELLPEFGKIASVDMDQTVRARAKFKVAFDVGQRTEAGTLNRKLESAARFLNMHAAAGVKPKNIKLAIVLHGGAARDVTRAAYYAASLKDDETKLENANVALVQALIDNGVEFYVCGQTAAYYGIKNEDLLPGVHMALSAMTAHALLQQDGYTLNPF